VEDCGAKRVKNIIINSGGFSEVGPEGAAYEADFMERARKYGIRVLGPNCQGIINSDPDVRAYCNFTFTMPEKGFISIVALSGGVAEVIHQGFSEMGVGTRIYASNGNACDITIPEIIRYLGNDEGTRVIVTYVEGLRDPQTFLAAAKEAAAKKPVLAMKAGRTMEGAQAAASHTGGLAKEDIATDLIFKKAGILVFHDEGEMIQAAAAFATQPVPKGNRVGIITNTGGPAVIATDILVGEGLDIPPLSKKTENSLKESLYAEASVHNPVDVLATGNADHYRACLDAMMEDDAFDSVLVHFVTPFFVDNESIARQIVEVNQKKIKPIVCNLMTDKRQWTETVRILSEGGVPFFSLPGAAARAMTALVKYHDIRSRPEGAVKIFNDVDKGAVSDALKKAKDAGRENLSAPEVYAILSAYGIPAPEFRSAASPEEAATAASEIGFPAVLKADSPSVVHKSDMGGVALDLNDADAVLKAAEKMRKNIDADDLAFFVQKQAPAGLEVILGAKAEEGLGHMVMFGLGGVFVEIMKDVIFNLAPVSDAEAADMLSSIQGAALLDGVRGSKGADKSAIEELILRLSQLVSDHPGIAEMDLNPVMAYDAGACAVDARIMIQKGE
jgi:acetate---CoA ligase (ADP-forming)